MKTKTKLLAFGIFLAARAWLAPTVLAQSAYEPYTFATLAGSAGYGSADGTGRDARFWNPSGAAVDSAGNVYVADQANNTIRKVTPAGVVTTLAGQAGSGGSVDGTGSDARFYSPSGVAVDSAGNVYVADRGNNTIRKVTPAGAVTTLAGLVGFSNFGSVDGTGFAARFGSPTGVAVDSAGNVYVADYGNYTIRKVTPTGVVTTLAGLVGNQGRADGTGNDARFNGPFGVAVDSAGNAYVADGDGIRKVTPAGVVTTLAGLGGGAVAVNTTGSLYLTAGNSIEKATLVATNWVVTTLAGLARSFGSADGTGSDARFGSICCDGPSGVAVDSAGNVYVADAANNTIRKVTPAGVVTTLAGRAGGAGSADGTGSDARFWQPQRLAVDSTGNAYVVDDNGIRKVTSAGLVTTLAGLGASAVAVDTAGNLYLAAGNSIQKATLVGTNWVVTTLGGLGGSAVAVDTAGNLYLAAGNSIQKAMLVDTNWVVTTLAGVAGEFGNVDGMGSAARFASLSGVAVDSAGNVYVADQLNATIRKVTPEGVVTTLAGLPFQYVDNNGILFANGSAGSADGMGSYARFNSPTGVAVDSTGNVYVADTGNNTIRKGFPALRMLNSGPGFGFNGGQFGFYLTGPVGQLLVVEASTDLVSWLPIWTNTFTGALNFSDPQSGIYSNRFYRARLP